MTKMFKEWTKAEYWKLHELVEKGVAHAEIARTLGKSCGSVSAKMSRIGLVAKKRSSAAFKMPKGNDKAFLALLNKHHGNTARTNYMKHDDGFIR